MTARVEQKHLADLQSLIEYVQDRLGWEVEAVELTRWKEDESWRSPNRFSWTIQASPPREADEYAKGD